MWPTDTKRALSEDNEHDECLLHVVCLLSYFGMQAHACSPCVLTTAVHVVRRDGRVAGLQEGRDLGKAKGYEIGYEVGLYEGRVPCNGRPPSLSTQGRHACRQSCLIHNRGEVKALQIRQAQCRSACGHNCLQAAWRAGASGNVRILLHCRLGWRPPLQRWMRCWAACRWTTPRYPAAAAAGCALHHIAAAYRSPCAQYAACSLQSHSPRRNCRTRNILRPSTTQDDSLLEVLEAMRGKFKTIVAMLGTAEAYASKDAPPAAAAADLDF